MYGMNRAALRGIYERGQLLPGFWDALHLERWNAHKFPDEDHVMGFLNGNSTHVNCAQFMAYPGMTERPWSQAFGRERNFRGVLTIHHLDAARFEGPGRCVVLCCVACIVRCVARWRVCVCGRWDAEA